MKKKRILIVDDERSFTRLLKSSLEVMGHYDVQVENRPEDALGAAKAFHPDLVLMDVFMPRLSGGDVAEQFHADEATKSVPIVFLTAAISRSRMAQHQGFILRTRVVAKPASLEEIVTAINGSLPQPTVGAEAF